MREIKFRAWAKVNAFSVGSRDEGEYWRMCEVSTLHLANKTARILVPRNLDMPSDLVRYGKKVYARNEPFGKTCILMQYTGLKDKNGKEIYEGDVLEVDNAGTLSLNYLAEVEYHDGRFSPLVTVEEGYNAIDNYSTERYRVIGNIYENPNLLTN